MRHYKVWSKFHPEWPKHVFAPTRGQAKMDFYRYITDVHDAFRYTDIRASVTDEMVEPESFRDMTKYRQIGFAYVGMKVNVDGSEGIIVGSNHSMNLDVYFTTGPQRGRTGNAHPHWRVGYYDRKGDLVKQFND